MGAVVHRLQQGVRPEGLHQLVESLKDEEKRHEACEDVLGELGEELDERRSLKVVMLHDQLTKENETNN